MLVQLYLYTVRKTLNIFNMYFAPNKLRSALVEAHELH
jgi:hypothetical protein